MNEERAIELCLKHRDPVGFEFLAGKYRREAFFHAFALLGNEQDALDACQEAFARAFAGIVRLPALPKFYPWFYCILRNHCLNVLARRRTSEEFRVARVKELDGSAEAVNPGSLLERLEEQERMQRAMAALKPEHREILTREWRCGRSF
jgi:RNA polymerase sigma-70 factor, ECF subfamily